MYYFQKSFLLCLPAFLSADVNRFLEPISLKPKTHFQDAIYGTVTSQPFHLLITSETYLSVITVMKRIFLP